MLDSSRIRAAVGWTFCWYLAAGLLSVPLAAVRMPSGAVPCDDLASDPAWAAWVFRDVLWLSMAGSLPVSAAVTAVLVWRSGLPVKTCAAVGAGVGLVLVLATLGYAMATAYCYDDLTRIE